MHEREHVLMPPDHGDHDGTPKLLEFFVAHLESPLHFPERRLPLVLG
jgi:hypothetical protein